MAAGLPVVANPVGVQKNLVRHGETGFLVETPDEWQDAVAWLQRKRSRLALRQMGGTLDDAVSQRNSTYRTARRPGNS